MPKSEGADKNIARQTGLLMAIEITTMKADFIPFHAAACWQQPQDVTKNLQNLFVCIFFLFGCGWKIKFWHLRNFRNFWAPPRNYD